jgi:hypothetical protein
VLPHFDRIERWMPGIVARRTGGLVAGQSLVGIDEETALVSADGGWRVEGLHHVWVVEPDGSRTPFGAGATLALPPTASARRSPAM